jgi:hypothetical protein
VRSKHAIDLLLQEARAPALGAAHLGVELALQRILEGDEQPEVRPAQLSPQCGDNLRVGEGLGELHHPPEALLAESPAESRLQMSPQRGDNLGAVRRALLPQDVAPDAATDLPVERRQRGVRRLGHAAPGGVDQLRDLVRERGGDTGERRLRTGPRRACCGRS